MRKDQVKLSNVKNIPALIFAGTFDSHMKLGDKSGQSHSGLHLLCDFKKPTGQALQKSDIVQNAVIAGKIGEKSATITITDIDLRATTFKASVDMYGKAKVSTFFPPGMDISKAKECIKAAWINHCTYGTSAYGGADVDIYQQMRSRFGLNWVGMATLGGQEIWVGSALAGSVVTAFPAVNNKFN